MYHVRRPLLLNPRFFARFNTPQLSRQFGARTAPVMSATFLRAAAIRAVAVDCWPDPCRYMAYSTQHTGRCVCGSPHCGTREKCRDVAIAAEEHWLQRAAQWPVLEDTERSYMEKLPIELLGRIAAIASYDTSRYSTAMDRHCNANDNPLRLWCMTSKSLKEMTQRLLASSTGMRAVHAVCIQLLIQDEWPGCVARYFDSEGRCFCETLMCTVRSTRNPAREYARSELEEAVQEAGSDAGRVWALNTLMHPQVQLPGGLGPDGYGKHGFLCRISLGVDHYDPGEGQVSLCQNCVRILKSTERWSRYNMKERFKLSGIRHRVVAECERECLTRNLWT